MHPITILSFGYLHPWPEDAPLPDITVDLRRRDSSPPPRPPPPSHPPAVLTVRSLQGEIPMEPPIIDQDGKEQTYTAVYWRYQAQLREEFDTPEDALAFLRSGWNNDFCAPQKVEGPEGQDVFSWEQISAFCDSDNWPI